MTAEIAIMNKSAVALAADSAVTIQTPDGPKIYNTNKLFTLSKYHPVGIMIYGNANLMNIPWETIIKSYRHPLRDKSSNTIEEYGVHFIGFLDNNTFLFPESEQEDFVRNTTLSYLKLIRKNINELVEDIIHASGKISIAQIKRIVRMLIKHWHDHFENLNIVSAFPANFDRELLKKYNNVFEDSIKSVFQKLPLSKSSISQLRQICVNIFVRDTFKLSTDHSGIVIAGFGDNEIFPSLASYSIAGVINNKLKYVQGASDSISIDNTASVLAFAQKEMVVSFMEGIDPYYKQAFEVYIKKVFEHLPEEIVKNIKRLNAGEKKSLIEKIGKIGEAVVLEMIKEMKRYTQERNINPIIDTVSVLPKDELASMAEALVNLTSFKRRVTLEAETVGGPIDVALISKGDGFIWVKRKHYFKAELNPHFLANYFVK